MYNLSKELIRCMYVQCTLYKDGMHFIAQYRLLPYCTRLKFDWAAKINKTFKNNEKLTMSNF